MALDVYIRPDPGLPRTGEELDLVCSLEDDGSYWFLYPLFEDLARQTGQHIDPYGSAIFSGPSVPTATCSSSGTEGE